MRIERADEDVEIAIVVDDLALGPERWFTILDGIELAEGVDDLRIAPGLVVVLAIEDGRLEGTSGLCLPGTGKRCNVRNGFREVVARCMARGRGWCHRGGNLERNEQCGKHMAASRRFVRARRVGCGAASDFVLNPRWTQRVGKGFGS